MTPVRTPTGSRFSRSVFGCVKIVISKTQKETRLFIYYLFFTDIFLFMFNLFAAKKGRSPANCEPPYSKEEIKLLLSLVHKYKDIIESEESGSES